MKKILPLPALVIVGTLLLSKPVQSQEVGPGYTAPYLLMYSVCLNDPKSFVHVRSAPSREASSMGRLRDGSRISFLRRFVASDGMYWAQIDYSGMNAYVRDDYICIES